jgi:hypothetical protein
MTDIDDSAAFDAALLAALKLGNGTIGYQVGFEAALLAYASSLRQQLAEAQDYAKRANETAQTFLREREEAYAKLERLDKAARKVVERHGFCDA